MTSTNNYYLRINWTMHRCFILAQPNQKKQEKPTQKKRNKKQQQKNKAIDHAINTMHLVIFMITIIVIIVAIAIIVTIVAASCHRIIKLKLDSLLHTNIAFVITFVSHRTHNDA